MKSFLVILPILASVVAHANGLQKLKGVRYVSCAKKCIVLETSEILLSTLSPTIVAQNQVKFTLKDLSGRVEKTYSADRMTMNPTLEMISLESNSGEFATYDLAKDQFKIYHSTAVTP